MIDYSEYPCLAGIYLEDSYVLDVAETPGQLTFMLDAALTPESPQYRPPRPREHHCYTPGKLISSGASRIDWERRIAA
ncbi:hypothetical protein [Mycolicibacterium baixiangningiae]|uniref:hypothetical protein n=1 Tax=Mycolicibacterium baixiangningiae TaxID=2761578 RepID=UPI001D00673C|nr:hypothetical protein [Mycolicibacterium baixiangningiae]